MFMSVLAVTVNCALISTSGLLGRFFPDLTAALYCIIFIAVEVNFFIVMVDKFICYKIIIKLITTIRTENIPSQTLASQCTVIVMTIWY